MREPTQPTRADDDEVAVVDAADLPGEPAEDEAELEELLISEITIDGMCGVY